MDHDTLIDDISDTLSKDPRVVFAYLYGSAVEDDAGNDIDIAVYSIEQDNPHELAADVKIALHRKTGLIPDLFDIRVINGILEYGDIFGLLYLKNVLAKQRLLVDKDVAMRKNFIEKYGLKFRECEGLIAEVLA